MKISKIVFVITVLMPLSLFAAAEVTAATAEDISAFDRNIEEAHGQNNNGSFNDDSSAKVAKSVSDFKKEKNHESEKINGVNETNGKNNDGDHDDGDHNDGNHGDKDRGERNQHEGQQDAAPRGEVSSGNQTHSGENH